MKNVKTQNTGRAPEWAERMAGGPIDWAAWTAESMRPTGNKGRKMSPEICAKFSAAQKARFARQRALLAEAVKLQPKAAPAPAVTRPSVTDVAFGVMEPGKWYATRDVASLGAVKYQGMKAFMPRWWEQGLLERAQNPDWKPPEKVGGHQEPKWLYRLTKEGEQRHRLAVTLL